MEIEEGRGLQLTLLRRPRSSAIYGPRACTLAIQPETSPPAGLVQGSGRCVGQMYGLERQLPPHPSLRLDSVSTPLGSLDPKIHDLPGRLGRASALEVEW